MNSFISDVINMFSAQRKLYNRAHETYDDKSINCKINGHQYDVPKIFMIQCVDGTHKITKTYKCKNCGKETKFNYVE